MKTLRHRTTTPGSADLGNLPGVERRAFRRGETLLHEGTPWGGLDVLVEGRVLLLRTVGMRRHVVALLGPGDALDVAPLVMDATTTRFTGIGATPGCLLHLPANHARRLLREQPDFQRYVFRLLAHQMELLAQRINDLAFKEVRARLASWILAELPSEGPVPTSPVVPRYLSLRDLAALLGTQREVVSRALGRLVQEGVVVLDAHRIVVLNVERLQDIAEGDEHC